MTALGCCACAEIGPLLTAPGTSGRDWRCGDCGHVWRGTGDPSATYDEDDRVYVRYPLAQGTSRDEWPWLPATIVAVCDPTPCRGDCEDPCPVHSRQEYYVRVDVEELAEPSDEDDELLYPACYRTAEEIRPPAPKPHLHPIS